jgi:lipopolysaccharide export system permease protein
MILSRLDRYIIGAILRASILTAIALVGLLLFFTFIDELDELSKNYQITSAFIFSLLSAPRYVFEVFPIAVLLGGLLGLGGLAASSELVAMRAAGFTLLQIVLAVLKAGLVLLVFVVMFGEFVAPQAEQYAQQIRIEKKSGQITSKTRYGFWARDGSAYINIRKILSDTRLEDLYIYELDGNNKLTLHGYAESADYKDTYWQINHITQTRLNQDGAEKHEFDAVRWDSLLNPALLNVIVVKPALLPIWELNRYIDFMDDNGQSATDYRVAFWLKIATPVAALVMLVLAVPFALSHQRSGTGQRIFLGAMIGAVFFLLTRAVSYMAVVYDLNPPIATFTPALVCLAASVWLLKRVR